MKYYVFRRSKRTGKIEVLRTKCSGCWCSKEYLLSHPECVWKFSKQGAKKIVDRYSEHERDNAYWLEPVDAIKEGK